MESILEEIRALEILRLRRAAHCRKHKPWLKSTGPKSKLGKEKVTENLPNNKITSISKIDRNLQKIKQLLDKLDRKEERAKQQQIAEFKKFDKLAKLVKKKIENESTDT